MNTLQFLEDLAGITHHQVNFHCLDKCNVTEISKAYTTNDNGMIRSLIGEDMLVANPTDVVQL